jgi:hypothetical protein
MNSENARLQTIFDYKDMSLNDELEAVINCEGYQNIKFYINCYVGDPSICDVCDPYETISYTIECSPDGENWFSMGSYYKADTTMYPGDHRHLYRTIDGWIQYEKMMNRFLRIKFFKKNNQHINNNTLKVSVEMNNTDFVTKDFCDSSFVKFYNRALTQEEIVEAVENREDQLLLQRLYQWTLKEKHPSTSSVSPTDGTLTSRSRAPTISPVRGYSFSPLYRDNQQVYRDNQQAYAQFANLPQNEIIKNSAPTKEQNNYNLDLVIRKCNPQEIVPMEYPKTTILDEKDRDIGFCVGWAHDNAPQKDWRDAWYDRYDDE